jgi:hypothetical protein
MAGHQQQEAAGKLHVRAHRHMQSILEIMGKRRAQGLNEFTGLELLPDLCFREIFHSLRIVSFLFA